MAKRQALADVNNDGKVSKMTKGPIVDTAANISIVTKQDSVYLENRYKMLKPEEVRTATGKVAVTEAGPSVTGIVNTKFINWRRLNIEQSYRLRAPYLDGATVLLNAQ